MGAVSGRGCRAAGDAGTWSPRGESFLRRSRRGAATGAARGRRASARWAGPRRGGLERRGGRPGRLCGWAESEAAAREGEKLFFIYIFKNFLKASFQILF